MHADVVIIGGGVMGSAAAWFLSRDPDFHGRITIVERDGTFARASSSLSASAIRQQFTTPVSVAMSDFGWEFLSQAETLFGHSVGLEERGYLLLGNTQPATQSTLVLDHAELCSRFSWLNCDDIDSATFGSVREGWFDGPALHRELLTGARQAGADLVCAGEARLLCAQGRVHGVQLEGRDLLEADIYINACGAWSGKLLAAHCVELPVTPRKRDVFVFTCATPPEVVPMVWDPSGLWFRPEGSGFICGMSPPDDPDDAELIPEYTRFDSQLWPLLAARVPAFASVRLSAAWSGYYEYCRFDQNGFVGPCDGLENLLLACGFSGHGMQHAPAAGRGIAELVVHGRYRSLDLSALHHSRVAANCPLTEIQIA